MMSRSDLETLASCRILDATPNLQLYEVFYIWVCKFENLIVMIRRIKFEYVYKPGQHKRPID